MAALAAVHAQSGPVDPSTTPDCTFFDTAVDESYTCDHIEAIWQISHADFVRWVRLLLYAFYLTANSLESLRQGRLQRSQNW